MKTLIIYLSATGNTAQLANQIAKSIENTDLFAITLKTKIPKNHFWLNFKFGFLMSIDVGFRYSIPDINVGMYDQVILGSPIWMGRAAPPLIKVAKKLKIENKIKGVFVTCGGNPGNVFDDISERISIDPLKARLAINENENYQDQLVLSKIEDFVNCIEPEYEPLPQILEV